MLIERKTKKIDYNNLLVVILNFVFIFILYFLIQKPEPYLSYSVVVFISCSLAYIILSYPNFPFKDEIVIEEIKIWSRKGKLWSKK